MRSFFCKNLKNYAFCKVHFAIFFTHMLKNRTLFSKICYCGVDKKAVILHSIKNGLFLTPKS